MNEDELKRLWQQQPLREPAVSAAQVISAMGKQTARLRRVLDGRDLRELIVCGVMVVVFACFYWRQQSQPFSSRLGHLIVIGSLIFIAWKLIHARRSTPPAPAGATVVETLRADLESVRTQSRLLGSVLWWYVLPPTIGLLVSTWFMQIDVSTKIVSTAMFLAVDVGVCWLNRWARAKQLLPLQAQLEALLHSAETGEPLDQKQESNLRTIALSMAAADRVKPAEFKVAFWQIALYGEIGFIGIWFFWMIGQGIGNGNVEWKALGKPPEMVTQPFGVGETNRYNAVAREIIDRLNEGDHDAVQERFNRRMSAALPPKRASDFFISLAARFGRIEALNGPAAKTSGGWILYDLHCEKGDLTMSLAVDAEDKISGLYFRPVSPRVSRNLPGAAARIFRWQRLVWLAPFFIGGLLYSWVLQKATERAVGISTAGIHLYKGQNLIFWNEIKEVRPLRILNIRSLWLIKESGEKTITPWSSLERPADLRAAVETCAPPDHPIRAYLSLLRGS